MSYAIQSETYTPEKFIAGEFPVATDICEVNTGKSVKKYEPVKLVGGKLEPVVKVAASTVDTTKAIPAKTEEENTTEGLYGIASEAATASKKVVVYLTGEFFGSEISLPTDVTLATLTPAFRKLGIFLK